MEEAGGGAAHPSSPRSSIQAIKRGDVHRITSGQVVLDIQSAVKELIENALDAGATAIEVRFKEYGADLIEVADNGSGIESSNYNSLALKHHTSKLQDFADLIRVTTFGFRGEALSSLCELAKVQFVTATQSEDPVGTILEMNRDGTIQSRDRKVARKRGTTVSVSDLFYTLPVRRKELVKNVKREFAKAQGLLQAYAIISSGVRWIVSNTVKGKKNTIMTIPASSPTTHLSANVTAVFGPKAAPDLVPLDLQLSLSSIQRRSAISSRRQLDAAIEQSDPATVDSILSRFIEKTDFVKMEVLGQFNLGFIIARRKKRDGQEDDLMIIDQHAADEKYNFERLTNTTKLQTQRLIVPRTLQLSPSDELTAVDHKEALYAHGFQIEIDEEALPGSRIRLVALPISQRITFGVEDLEEVLHKLADEQPNSQRALSTRCSKWRNVLASRACRSSIMIGSALKTSKMETVIRHLSTLDQPWNCPHGRPTMRHLYDLNSKGVSKVANGGSGSAIDWASFA
ncbi:uncharacterized protein FA14DRAFT_168144 [Meira miltonrushii]|uniref:DNA mismatch repair protein PMS1 n=1 Tax=Meira miltonrushii TaxID=1280837 RepID=A0A316V6V7_9BASI|nr:uncharacterized protein FA14DRAFT_168144 [Meira miltonrushii]PWN33339.1 hypothetical protein FA14DRAFT_168144 [Meira miltonrushii]